MAEKKIGILLSLKDRFSNGLSKAVSGTQKFKNELSGTNNKISIVSKGIKSLSSTALKLGGAFAGFSAVKGAVNTFKDFEQSMANTGSIAGVTKSSEAYKQLEDAAMAAGRGTSKTAKEAADALGYMSLAGWNVQDSISGLMPVLRLSEATQADLATTSDLVTDSMSALGLGVNQLEKYLDVAAKANNKSNQTATQLMEAYIGVGGTFKSFGTSIEESSALLGVLANRGIKGSEAGTKMSSVLINLTRQSGESYKAMKALGLSAYDSQGKFKGVTNVLKELNEKTKDLSPKLRRNYFAMIGGKTQIDTLENLIAGLNTTNAEGVSELQALQNELVNSAGSLETMANAVNDTMVGSMARLNSAFDDFKINIVKQFEPYITPVINKIASNIPNITTAVTDSISSVKKFTKTIASIPEEGVKVAFKPILASSWNNLPKILGYNLARKVNNKFSEAIDLADSMYKNFKPKIPFINESARYFADNFSSGVKKFLSGQDLYTSFSESLKGLKSLLGFLFADGEDISSSFTNGIGSKLFKGIEGGFKTFSEIIESIKQAFIEIKSAYSDSFGEIIDKLKEFGNLLLNTFSNIGSGDINIGAELVNLLKETLIAIEPILTKVSVLAIDICSFIVKNWKPISAVVIGVGAAIKTVKMIKFAIDVGKATKALTLLKIAKIKDKAETLYLGALYVKDAILKGASTAATLAQTAAMGAWKIVSMAATATTTALGAAFNFLMSPMGLIILAIGALIAIGILLYKNWDKIKEKLIQVWQIVKAKILTIVDSFAEKFPNAFKIIIKHVEFWKSTLDIIIGDVKKVFQGFINFFKSIFTGDWKGAWEGIKQILSGVFGIIHKLTVALAQALLKSLQNIKEFFINKFVEIKQKITDILNNLAERFPLAFSIIKTYFNTFKENILVVIETIKGVFKGIIDFITGVFTGDWDKAWNGVVDIFKSIFNGVIDIIKNIFSGIFNIVHDITVAIAQKLIEIIGNIKESFINKFTEIKQKITDILNNLAEKFPVVFDTIKIYFETFKENISIVIETIKSIFKGIIDFITGVFTGDWDKAWNGVVDIFKSIFNGIGDIMKNTLNGVIKVINNALSNFSSIKIPEWIPLLGGKVLEIPKIPEIKGGYALGTQYFKGGITRINERGGEIVDLPNGSKVIPADKSKKITEKKDININININGNIYGEEDLINKISDVLCTKIKLALNNL